MPTTGHRTEIRTKADTYFPMVRLLISTLSIAETAEVNDRNGRTEQAGQMNSAECQMGVRHISDTSLHRSGASDGHYILWTRCRWWRTAGGVLQKAIQLPRDRLDGGVIPIVRVRPCTNAEFPPHRAVC